MTSERLGFRTWTESDLPLAETLWGDPLVTRLFDARGTLTQGQIKERLASEMATMESTGIQYWPVFLLEGNEFAGCCGLKPYRDDNAILEMGVHLCVQNWRKGLATEACQTVMTLAFTTLQVKGLFAGHHPENGNSRRLLERLGFRYTHSEFYSPTGLHHPSYILTDREYWLLKEKRS